jgi:hypothetical protein
VIEIAKALLRKSLSQQFKIQPAKKSPQTLRLAG